MFGVGANANFRFGVGFLASGNTNFHILDTNMLVSPTQNAGVGGIAQRQLPTPDIFVSQWNIGFMHTIAYKGGGGSEHDQKYAFCMQVY